mmetsp:Transcript_453/g.1054  ORF Transcript_453/g.1054 Transcript_453/m.1054 type:complete len:250 (-) Transcript_453:3199-3948(-)
MPMKVSGFSDVTMFSTHSFFSVFCFSACPCHFISTIARSFVMMSNCLRMAAWYEPGVALTPVTVSSISMSESESSSEESSEEEASCLFFVSCSSSSSPSSSSSELSFSFPEVEPSVSFPPLLSSSSLSSSSFPWSSSWPSPPVESFDFLLAYSELLVRLLRRFFIGDPAIIYYEVYICMTSRFLAYAIAITTFLSTLSSCPWWKATKRMSSFVLLSARPSVTTIKYTYWTLVPTYSGTAGHMRTLRRLL